MISRPNFLTDTELLFIETFWEDSKTYIANNGKKLNLHQINLPGTVIDKLSEFGDVIKSEVYELEQPYRIHNDTRNEVQSKWTCIVPLDLKPQGGVTVFDQYAYNFSYSLDPYYNNDYNKLLQLEDRKDKIFQYDENVKLPDIPELSHIRDKDKIGFTIKEKIEFEFNKLIAFPSINFHCSNNTNNFSNKSSLVIFTK